MSCPECTGRGETRVERYSAPDNRTYQLVTPCPACQPGGPARVEWVPLDPADPRAADPDYAGPESR